MARNSPPPAQKPYPHFDAWLSPDEAANLISDPKTISRNAFLPFLVRRISWIPYRADGARKPKERLIRYASRRDSVIFAYYRTLLSELYEKQLHDLNLSDSILAYRRIPVREGSNRGKSSIHFAKDAFDYMASMDRCCVVVADIKSFFDHIDHAVLKLKWQNLLGTASLPEDHYAVFKAITAFASVDLQAALRRLGYINNRGHKTSKQQLPVQLCTPKDFRTLIAGHQADEDGLIVKNKEPFGIPQGAPISDILANLYLIDFDRQMKTYVESLGGIYRRYSDDILIIIPGALDEGKSAELFLKEEICQHGDMLQIKSAKTMLVAYWKDGDFHRFQSEHKGRGNNGIEYLGLRFDGQNIYIRDSTLSRLYRKITFYARAYAKRLVKRYPGKSAAELAALASLSDFETRFGKAEDYDPGDVSTWTFRTYAKLVQRITGTKGRNIGNQIKAYRAYFNRALTHEIETLLSRQDR